MTDRRRKTIIGIAVILLGLFLLRAMPNRMAARQHMGERAAMMERGAVSAETGPAYDHQGEFHAHRGHGRMGGPLHLIGGLVRLVAFGGFAFLLFTLFKQRGGRASDDVEAEIRVGDAMSQSPAASVDLEALTEADLLAAMKRLGIKKLEL